MASRGPSKAIQALYTALVGINGSSGGYWNDLQRRVYGGLVLPEDDPRPMPYLSIDATDTVKAEALERGLRRRLQPVIVGYVAGKAGEEIDADSGIVRAYQLLEDIDRALMPTQDGPRWNLGETIVDEVIIGAAELAPGVHDGREFFEVAVPIEIRLTYDRDNIGSAA